MINATITRDDPTCKLLNPPSFPLSRAVGEDYRGGRLESTGDVIVAAEEWVETGGWGEGGGRKRETRTHSHKRVHSRAHTHALSAIDTIGESIILWHSNVRERSPLPPPRPPFLDDIDDVCRLLLRARLSQTIRLSCVSDSLCTPRPLKIPGAKELRHFARILLVH